MTRKHGLFVLLLAFLAIATTALGQGWYDRDNNDRYASGCRGFEQDDKVTDVTLIPGLTTAAVSEVASISWSFPQGVCSYRWLIEFTPLDAQGNALEPVYFRVGGDERRLDIPSEGLNPGMLYRIKVQLEYASNRYGPEKIIEGTPYTNCAESGTPGMPSEFSVKDQSWEGYNLADDSIELCWTPSHDSGLGCPDEYTIALRVQPSAPADLFDERYDWRFEKFFQAGCHRIKGIQQGTTYDIGIRAYNAANQTSGDVAVIQEYVTDRWTCLAGDINNAGDSTYYEWCNAARTGQCTPMSCDEIAQADMCGHPSVRRYDPERFTVVQYCAARCGCSTPNKEELGQIPYRQPDQNEWACCIRE